MVNDLGKFALHLLPSGVFREGVVNVLGSDVALDPENLWTEMETLRAVGVRITPENLKISARASILLPWHRELDALEEARLKDKKAAQGTVLCSILPLRRIQSTQRTVPCVFLVFFLYSYLLKMSNPDLASFVIPE